MRPIAGVRVVARSADGKETLRATETDASGRYQLSGLPRASVRLSVSRMGCISRRTAGGDINSLLDLASAADPVNQDFELFAGGVVSGRITDPQAEPIEGVAVELRRAGGPDSPPARAVTDDRGVYRVFGLEPSRYIMLARLGDPEAVPSYFPGSTDIARAQPIDVASGTETDGIDLRLAPEPAGDSAAGLRQTDSEELTGDPAGAAASPPPPGAGIKDEPLGSIGGHVLSAQTGELLKSASVTIATLLDGKLFSETQGAGPGGTFLFERLPPAAYSLQARKAGYAFRNLTRQIEVAEKQNRTGIEIKMDRVPVISGRIRDFEGRPVAGAGVAVYRLRWQKGHPVADSAGYAISDDRGMYRVTKLLPGRYIVGASKPAPSDGFTKGELDLGSGRTYYPAAASPSQAVALEARYGQELVEINLDMAAQETFFVSGVVADAEAGGPCLTCIIRAISLEESFGFTQAESGVAPNGAYVVRGLQPGRYRILVEKKSAGRKLVSSQILEITNRDLKNVNLVAGVARDFSGRVVFESEPPADPAADPKTGPKSGMTIVLTNPEGIGTFETAGLEEDRTFRFSGIASDDYDVQIVGLPRGAYLKAIRVGGQALPGPGIDMRDQGPLGPVELLVSLNSAKIAGQIRIPDARQNQARRMDATVKLFPRENQSPYLTSLRTGARPDGNFSLGGIAPGSYTAFAVSRNSTLDLGDPVCRLQMRNYGKAVELEAGKAAVLELDLVPEDQ